MINKWHNFAKCNISINITVHYDLISRQVDDYPVASMSWDLPDSTDTRLDRPKFIYFGRNGEYSQNIQSNPSSRDTRMRGPPPVIGGYFLKYSTKSNPSSGDTRMRGPPPVIGGHFLKYSTKSIFRGHSNERTPPPPPL